MPEYKFRQYIEKAIEEIDAGLFPGNAFGSNEAIAAMQEILSRWSRGLA